MVQHLTNPPQNNEFKALSGSLFPEEYPFNYDRLFDYRYYFIKYYMSQRNLIAIPKQ